MFKPVNKEQAKPILELLSNCKLSLFSKQNSFYAFYVALLSQLPTTISQEIPTAATNGRELVINPDYFLGLNNRERVGLLLHEAMHIAFMHNYRMEQRNPELWNHACDYAINDLLLNENITLPEGALFNPAFRGMTAEQIYEVLNQENQQQVAGQGQEGQGNEEEGEGQGSSSSFSKPRNKQKESFSWGIGKDLIPNHRQAEANLVQAELQALAQSVGSLPSHLKRWFEELGKNQIPWQLLLRRFLTKGKDSRFSYRRINKRCELLPRRMPHGLHSIELLIDTSASISQQQFNQFITEIYHLCQQTKPKQLVVSQFSDGLEARDKIKKSKDLFDLTIKSSGCTVLGDSIQTSKANILCIFTDGEIYDLDKQIPPSGNVLWLICNNRQSFVVPFGQTIHINS